MAVNSYDILIIGSGPAGVSAAIYAARGGQSVAVIGKDGGALVKAEKIENYYGLPAPVTGQQLWETGLGQLAAFDCPLFSEEVLDISWAGNFQVSTLSDSFSGKALILAMGAARRSPNIPGLTKLEGHGVSYCAVCDGFFYRGKDVCVLGAGEYAKSEAAHLLPLAKSVTILTNGVQPEASFPPEVEIVQTPVQQLEGEEKIAGIRFADGSYRSADGLFVALGSAGSLDIARKLGAVIQDGKIATDGNMATNLPGLYAAGDCVGGVLQVSVAVGEGAKAALAAISFLRKG